MRRLLFFLLLIILIFRIVTSLNSPLEGKRIRLTGILTTDPKEYKTSLLVKLQNYSFFIPQNPNVLFNSKIVVEGVVKGSNLEKVKLISSVPASTILSKTRAKILTTMRETLPEPHSSLLAGITIGAPNIPEQFGSILRKTGTSHIVVASGGNLAILAGFLEALFAKYLKRKTFLPIICSILVIYTLISGFGAPIVRALVMWLAIMFAQFFGRVVKTTHVLLFTVLIMLIVKPIWATDVSFQLSVGATSGILLLSTKFQKYFKKLTFIKEALSTSLAAQIGILPISIFVFRDVNILSPFWNTLVLWTVPYLTIIGMVGSVLSLIYVPTGKIILLLSYPFSWYFVKVLSM